MKSHSKLFLFGQVDLQAQARAHRIGQKKDVLVIRLETVNTLIPTLAYFFSFSLLMRTKFYYFQRKKIVSSISSEQRLFSKYVTECIV